MTKFCHLAKRKFPNSRVSRLACSSKFTFSGNLINILLAVSIFVCGLGYLIQANSLSTKGYKIKELEKKVTELKQEKSDLELEALSLQSMSSVKEKIKELNLVAALENDYLKPTPVAIAR